MLVSGACLRPLVLICALVLFWQCKEPKADKKIQEVQVVKTTSVPGIIKELAEFSAISVSDSIDIHSLLNFKMIDSTGRLLDAEIDQAAKEFNLLNRGKEATSFPIIEVMNTDKVIFMVQGRGYGGPLWAKLLVDKKTRQIEKLELDHTSESEGYGAGITYSSFEDQFTGSDLSQGESPFGLSLGGEIVVKGIYNIDGISGATVTCNRVVRMVNLGLQPYRDYLTL
ncbi:MAG: FMN-binding protein [Flavobacteriaceae bacterium]